MTTDWKTTTKASNILRIDYDMQADLIQGEPDYWVLCVSPESLWLLISLLNFEDILESRWVNFPSISARDQLIAETWFALMCPMACQEDIQAINSTLQSISLTLIEMRDRLGDSNGDLDTRLTEIKEGIAELDVTMADLGLPSLIDQIEPILNGVGVILGAPVIAP